VYLGDKQSEQDLRKAINNRDPKAADAQSCEAEFFIGQRKFVAGQKDAAKVHFAAALKSKATQLTAYRGAKLALK
jgi:lipoprotein NlpI